jgi:hypothetical protein
MLLTGQIFCHPPNQSTIFSNSGFRRAQTAINLQCNESLSDYSSVAHHFSLGERFFANHCSATIITASLLTMGMWPSNTQSHLTLVIQST